MIDWIKFFPLQLRMPKADAAFKGPSFADAKPIILAPGGNTLRLRAPGHHTEYEKNEIYLKEKTDLESGFRTAEYVATEHWEYSRFFFRSRTYWFEWFAGAAGDLSISVNVLTRKKGDEFRGVSFYYPRVFENAVANYLNTLYGFEKKRVTFIKQAPVNWRTHHHLPVFSCSFEVLNGDSPSHMFFMFPLTARHMVEVRFRHTTARKEVLSEMWSLARQIIDSVQLELSPASQMELARVKGDIGELSLTEEFPPLKWPIKVEEIENPPMPVPTLTRL